MFEKPAAVLSNPFFVCDKSASLFARETLFVLSQVSEVSTANLNMLYSKFKNDPKVMEDNIDARDMFNVISQEIQVRSEFVHVIIITTKRSFCNEKFESGLKHQIHHKPMSYSVPRMRSAWYSQQHCNLVLFAQQCSLTSHNTVPLTKHPR